MNRLFIDVREPFEFATGHAEGAINIPPAELISGAKALQNVPFDTELVIYCLSGSRSNTAMHILSQMGYANIVNGINKSQVNTRYFS